MSRYKKPNWAVKIIRKQDWDNYYIKDPNYSYLGEVSYNGRRRVLIGFMTFLSEQEIASNPELLLPTPEQLKLIDVDRKSKNMRPYPLEN